MLSGPLSSYTCVQSIQHEQEWRKPRGLDEHRGPPRGLLASQWGDTRGESSDVAARSGYHMISMALRPMSLRLSLGGRLVQDGRVAAGMVQITCPGTPVAARFQGPSAFLHLHVSEGLLREYADELPASHSPRNVRCGDTAFVRDPTIENLARALIFADAVSGAHEQVFADAVGMALVARLSGAAAVTGARTVGKSTAALPKWRLKRVEDYIDAHLGTRMSLADLAAAAGLSRMHFAAQFRAATGLRPHEYLLRKKIERAQRMLAVRDVPLVDVAFSLGFQTQAHFTTVFKRFVGATPNRWRQARVEFKSVEFKSVELKRAEFKGAVA